MTKQRTQEMNRVSTAEFLWAKQFQINPDPSELSAYDKQQLQDGTTRVRSILGPEAGTDEEIQESLWHYYYDVEKTVNCILSMALSITSSS